MRQAVNRTIATGHKADVDSNWLIAEREKFAPCGTGTVSVEVCFVVGRCIILIAILPIRFRTVLMPSGFIFRQDGAVPSTHCACYTRLVVLLTNFDNFIAKDEWPPNSSDLNVPDYHTRMGCHSRKSHQRSGNFEPRWKRRSGTTFHKSKWQRLFTIFASVCLHL